MSDFVDRVMTGLVNEDFAETLGVELAEMVASTPGIEDVELIDDLAGNVDDETITPRQALETMLTMVRTAHYFASADWIRSELGDDAARAYIARVQVVHTPDVGGES